MKAVSMDADYCNTWLKANNKGDSASQTLMQQVNNGTTSRPQKFYIMDQDYVNSSTLQA